MNFFIAALRYDIMKIRMVICIWKNIWIMEAMLWWNSHEIEVGMNVEQFHSQLV